MYNVCVNVITENQVLDNKEEPMGVQAGDTMACLIKARRVLCLGQTNREFFSKWDHATRSNLMKNIIGASSGSEKCQSIDVSSQVIKVALKRATGMYGVRFTERTYEHTPNTHQLQWYAWTFQVKHRELYLRTLDG